MSCWAVIPGTRATNGYVPIFEFNPAVRRLLAQSPLVKSPDIKNMLQFGSPDVIQRYILWQRCARDGQITQLLEIPGAQAVS